MAREVASTKVASIRSRMVSGGLPGGGDSAFSLARRQPNPPCHPEWKLGTQTDERHDEAHGSGHSAPTR